ncbi:MAG: hypothetical protein NT084_14390 [Bacteroidetes bacterium]|jgi:hypothetical protein|nr:hypothetical protein [Bacteroidota bacterium]
MKKIVFSSLILIASLSSCNTNASKTTNDSTAVVAPAAPKSGNEVAAVKYQCPMKCEGEKTYAAPGKCPSCQMDLAEIK